MDGNYYLYGSHSNISLAQNNVMTVQNQSLVQGNNGIKLSEEEKTRNQKLLDLYRNTTKAYFFNKTLLLNGNPCRIGEVEFYQAGDPFIHKDPHQLTFNCFRFHRAGDQTKVKKKNEGVSRYKNGTYKGLDITIGAQPDFYGGLLVRSILTPQGFIEGPCKVVDYILNTCGFPSIDALVDHLLILGQQQGIKEPIPCDFENPLLKIVSANYQETPIYNGPRVGLTLKKEKYVMGPRCQYIMKPYRFTCFPAILKIDRHMLVVQARFNQIPDDTIIRDFNLQQGLLYKWVSHFIKGKTMICEFFLTPENSKLDKVAIQLNCLGFFTNLDGY